MWYCLLFPVLPRLAGGVRTRHAAHSPEVINIPVKTHRRCICEKDLVARKTHRYSCSSRQHYLLKLQTIDTIVLLSIESRRAVCTHEYAVAAATLLQRPVRRVMTGATPSSWPSNFVIHTFGCVCAPEDGSCADFLDRELRTLGGGGFIQDNRQTTAIERCNS